MPELSDEEILDLYFARDEQAIRETEIKYGAFCLTISRNILGSHVDAEECVNDTWLRAWDAIPPQRPQKFRTWLAKVVRNLSLDRYRRNHANKRNQILEESFEELEECIPIPEEDANRLPGLINRFLLTQNKKDQQLFVGKYWYAYSLEELAKGHGMPISTVKYRIDHVREKLREFLGKEGYSI